MLLTFNNPPLKPDNNNEYMYKVFFVFSFLILSGCAKFSLDFSSLSSNNSLTILIPNPVFLTQPDEITTISGTCEAGADLNITGPGMVGAVNMLCASDGTFTNSITVVSNALTQNITVTQTDNQTGQTQINNANVQVTTHCAPASMATCALSGSGRSSTDPYVIGDDIACLQEMRVGLSCYYSLNSNIDATATSTWNGGLGWLTVGTTENVFLGQLQGNSNTISNLIINDPAGPASFMGVVGNNTNSNLRDYILNLNFENANVTTLGSLPAGAGLLASEYHGVRVSNININNSTLNSTFAAGIMGYYAENSNFNNITITNSTLHAQRESIGNIGFLGGFLRSIDNTEVDNINFDIDMNMINSASFVPDVNTSNQHATVNNAGFIGFVDATSNVSNSTLNININTPGHTGGFRFFGGAFESISGTVSNITANINMALTSTHPDFAGQAEFRRIGGFASSNN